MKTKKIPPVHPGEILKDEVLDGMSMTQNALAVAIKVPPRRINEIVLGKRSITADTALRLATFLRMSPEFWLGLQMKYDLAVQKDKVAEKIRKEIHPVRINLAVAFA